MKKKLHRESTKAKLNKLKEKLPDKKLEVVLESFSEADLGEWRRFGKGLESYNLEGYYCFEKQRHANHAEIIQSLMVQGVEVDVTGWIRIVDYAYSMNPLSACGSLYDVGGRFNIGSRINPVSFPSFPALYLASNEKTARAEKFPGKSESGLTPEDFALRPKNSFSTILLKGKVQNVFDLTSSSDLKGLLRVIKSFEIPKRLDKLASDLKIDPLLPVTKSDILMKSIMDPNWRAIPQIYGVPSNSQILARYLREVGFEGVVYKSVRGSGKCLAVFPENFEKSTSKIEIQGKTPEGTTTVLSSNTWKNLV